MSETTTVFATEWFSIEARPARDGGAPYYRFKMPNGVVVLPVTEDGRFVTIRQFRPALERMTLEFPAGAVDPDEDPAEAARRELWEETGYRCERLELLGRGSVRIDREDCENYLFVALGCRKDPDFIPQEQIEAREMDVAEFTRAVDEGTFDHLVALSMFVLAEIKLGRKLLTLPQEKGHP